MDYKENTIYVGYSDRAQLHLNFADHGEPLKMGEDGRYEAYVITDLSLVPAYYTFVTIGNEFVEIMDDEGATVRLYGENILVYRAGLRGILIATVTNEELSSTLRRDCLYTKRQVKFLTERVHELREMMNVLIADAAKNKGGCEND